MDIRCISEFLLLASELNYTTAAKKLFITRPTLTEHMRSLEAELGCKLLEHGSRQPELTPAGKKFVSTAQQLVDTWEEIRAQYSSFSDNYLAITIAPVNLAFIEALLYKARRNIQTRQPEKQIEFVVGGDPVTAPDRPAPQSPNSILVNGRKSLGKDGAEPPAVAGYRGFYAGTCELKFFVTWSSPLFSKRDIGIADLDGETVVLSNGISKAWKRDGVTDYLARHGARLRLDIREFTDSSEYFAHDFNGDLGVIPAPLIPRYGLDSNERFRVFSPSGITLDTDFFALFREDVLQTKVGAMLFDEMRLLAPQGPGRDRP